MAKQMSLEAAISHMAGHVKQGNLCLFREPHGGSDAGTRLARLTITNTMGKGIVFLEAPSTLNSAGAMTPAISKWEQNTTGDQVLTSVAKTAEGAGWMVVCIDSKSEDGGFHTKGGQEGKARQEWMARNIFQTLKAAPQNRGALCPIGLMHLKGTNFGGGYDSLARILTQQAPLTNRDTSIMNDKIRYQVVKRGNVKFCPAITFAQ